MQSTITSKVDDILLTAKAKELLDIPATNIANKLEGLIRNYGNICSFCGYCGMTIIYGQRSEGCFNRMDKIFITCLPNMVVLNGASKIFDFINHISTYFKVFHTFINVLHRTNYFCMLEY